MVVAQCGRACPPVRRTPRGVECVNAECRYEEDALLRHHRSELGVFIDVGAVLDGVDAGLDRKPQARTPKSVAHDAPPAFVRLVHQRLQLFAFEQQVFGAKARRRAGASGGCHLDDVGPRANHLSHLRPHAVRPVGHAPRQPGVGRAGRPVAEWTGDVAHAARRRDEAERHEQPRPGNQTLLYGHPKAGVEPAAVPDRRVARLEGLLEHGGDAHVPQAARLGDAPAAGDLVAERGQVVVAVDETRQKGQA